MRNTSYLDCRMRCSAAVLLHLPHSGHVLPPAVRSQLTTALQLSQFFIFLLRANVFDLCFVQCNVLALFHHHELNPLQTPSKPQRVFGLSRILHPSCVTHQAHPWLCRSSVWRSSACALPKEVQELQGARGRGGKTVNRRRWEKHSHCNSELI